MRNRITYANVTATLALFIALGGVSWAAIKLPRNSVGAKQLKANAVTTAKVKDGSLLKGDFRPGDLPAGAAGPTGPAGADGATGPTGPAGSNAQFNGAAAGGALAGTYPNPTLAPSALADVVPGRRVSGSTSPSAGGGFATVLSVPGAGMLEARCDAGNAGAYGLTLRWTNSSGLQQRVIIGATSENVGAPQASGSSLAAAGSEMLVLTTVSQDDVGRSAIIRVDGSAVDASIVVGGLTKVGGAATCYASADAIQEGSD